jgi:hypothetical protein
MLVVVGVGMVKKLFLMILIKRLRGTPLVFGENAQKSTLNSDDRTAPPTPLYSMETSPTKKPRRANLKGKKNGGKAIARLRSLKGELDDDHGIDSVNIARSNDRGFRDVRTLTEKIRMLSWVRATFYTFANLDFRLMHIMSMAGCL